MKVVPFRRAVKVPWSPASQTVKEMIRKKSHPPLRPCPPLSRGGWRAPIYSLAPHCLSGGRGPRSGEGGLPKARRKPIASSRNPTAGSLPLHPLPTPVQGWVASAAMPEGVSCLRQLYERGAFYFLGAFLFSPADFGGAPLPPLTWSPHPRVRGWASLG